MAAFFCRCPCWSKTKSVGAHSICARGSLSHRKRARADMESAPTFFTGTERGTFFPVACVGATIARPSTYRRTFLSPTACGRSPRAEFSPFVGNVIRRGAFYMRPRKFALPQAGTGGYGIRPYVFCGGGEGHVFPCCVRRGDHWSPVNLPPQRIFRDSSLIRQAGTGEQCSPLQMFFDSLSPKYSCPPHGSLPHRLRAEPPSQRGPREGGAPRGAFSLCRKRNP